MEDIERTFSELESLHEDKAFVKAVNEVREVNELLAQQPVDDQEATKIITDINKMWRTSKLRNLELNVTGDVYLGGTYESEVVYSTLEKENSTFLADYPFFNTGFQFVTSMEEDGDGFVLRQQIILVGRVKLDDVDAAEGDDAEDDVTMTSIAVPVTDLVSVELKGLTPTKAGAWLDAYTPEAKELIDDCLVGSDNESEALIRLRDMEFPPIFGTQEEVDQLLLSIESYVVDALECETYIPYMVEIAGECTIYDREVGQQPVVYEELVTDRPYMMVMQDVYAMINTETRVYRLWFKGEILRSKGKSSVTIDAPLASLYSIRSGREILEGK